MNDPIVKMAFPVRELLHQVMDCGITTLKTGSPIALGLDGGGAVSLPPPFIFDEPRIICPPLSSISPQKWPISPGQTLPTSRA